MSLADRLRKSCKPIPFLPETSRRPEVLLCANTVKPMHGVTPRTILGLDWWNKTRMAAYRSTGFCCIACGVPKAYAIEHQWLEGHELYDTDYKAGRMVYLETVPLCHYCHNFIHDGRLRALLLQGQITGAKLLAIAAHGRRVLKEAKLKRPAPYSDKIAEWGEWRLILFGKEYPPVYPDYEAWLKAFGGNIGFDKKV